VFKTTSQRYTIIAYYYNTEQSYGKIVNVGEKYLNTQINKESHHEIPTSITTVF